MPPCNFPVIIIPPDDDRFIYFFKVRTLCVAVSKKKLEQAAGKD